MAGHPTLGGRPIRNICCIGGGYVGGPSAAVIANKAPHIEVAVVDIDARRIAGWNSDTLPVYEPNLFELVKPARDGSAGRRPNLRFSTDVDAEVARADIVFIGVNTPTKRTGLGAGKASDLSWLESATRRVAQAARHDLIVVEKSTVPCGTAQMMRKILTANGPAHVRFEVLSNPEFLAEGTAVANLLSPDRILIGCMQTEPGYAAAHALADVYANWVPREKLVTMNLWSSELSKLAANALLAQRISSINALSSICEATNASIQDVSYAVGLDRRIGPKMLNASVGFGGSCFKKDVMNLVYISESLGLHEVAAYFNGIIEVNEYQMTRFVRNIVRSMHSTLSNKKLAIFGFAYKKDTGDTRESPAITVVRQLLAENALVHVYDPQVSERQILDDLSGDPNAARVTVSPSPYDAADGAHAVVILTEWDLFYTPKLSSRTAASAPSQLDPAPDGLGITAPSLDSSAGSDAGSSDAAEPSGTSSVTELTCPSPGGGGGDDGGEEQQKPQLLQQEHQSASKRLDWARIHRSMSRPAHVFDGRNTVDVAYMRSLGFIVEALGVAS